MSTKNNRICQKTVKRTLAYCLKGQKVGGDGGIILQRTIAIVLKGQRGFRYHIIMTSKVTRRQGSRVSAKVSPGSAGQRVRRRGQMEGSSVSAEGSTVMILHLRQRLFV